MGKLLLESLEIQNFRGLRHLQIEKLERVNLIVGKNNVGKTALLESLRLYAQQNSVDLIWSLLQERDELKTPLSSAKPEELLQALKYLFFGRNSIENHSSVIQIGPLAAPEEVLRISIEWGRKRVKSLADQPTLFDLPDSSEEVFTSANLIPRLIFRRGESLSIYPLIYNRAVGWLQTDKEEVTVPSIFISANGLNERAVVSLWDEIALTDFEKEVISAFRILAPGIDGINFVGGTPARRRGDFNVLREEAFSPERIPIVKIEDIADPIPLRSLGNGMQHILDIILALANTKDGLLLVDEIENGIHYSAQKELWQMVFRLARRLNIQVFATTHSWDCIEGFQQAVLEEKQEDGLLIRLSLKGDDIKSVLYDERRLEIATREQIEVR